MFVRFVMNLTDILMRTYTISERSLRNFLKYAYELGTTNHMLDQLDYVQNEVIKMVNDNDTYFKELEKDLKPKLDED
tara:strand:- start:235 stop:465 length:231 start_codon:yes stop_codon:yes gene_type:complete